MAAGTLPGLATRIAGIRATPRHSAAVRVTHWINLLCFLGLLVSGFAILLAHPRFYWGETGGLGTPSVLDLPLPYMRGGPSGWGRRLHFFSAWICILNGSFYLLAGIVSKHFRKDLLPVKADLSWRSISRVLWNHLRLKRRRPETSVAYDAVQRLTYLVVVFVLFPGMIWTAVAMSPAVVSVFPAVVTSLGGHETARTLHFLGADLLVLFLFVHVTMVYLAGFTERVGAMIVDQTARGQSVGGETSLGRNAAGRPAARGEVIYKSFSRRKLITTGLATAAGASGVAVARRLADRYGLIPPDYPGILGVGETLTYASQRLLTSHHSLVREFNRSDISKVAPVNGDPPADETYHRLLAGGWAGWRLQIDGLVTRPSSFSMEELKRMPSGTQVTHQACEEGWSFIAEWTGVPLFYLLHLVGAQPQSKFVFFFPFGYPLGKWGSLDMADAWHPQTLIAYAMNGREIPTPHGAPVRLRVPRALGFKSLKYLSRITVTDTAKGFGKGLGSSSPEVGYSWYGGI